MLIAVAVVAVVAIVAAVVISRRGSGSSSASSETLDRPSLSMPSSEPEEAWTVDVGETISDATFIGEDAFVLTYEDGDYFVMSFDRDREERWREQASSSASYLREVDGKLVVQNDDGDSSSVDAFDPDTGRRLWTSDVLPEYPLGGSRYLGTRYDDGNVSMVVDITDGEAVWDAKGYPSGRCHDLLAVAEDDYDDDGMKVFLYDIETGDEVWSGDGYWADCTEGVVAVSNEGEVTAFDIDSGDELWQQDGRLVGAIGGLVIVQDDSDLLGLEAGDGEERWSTDAPEYAALQDGHLIVSDDRDTVLDPADGEEIVRSRKGGEIVAVQGGWLEIYQGDGESDVTLYDSKISERWTVTLDGYPRRADGLIYLIDDDRLIVYR